MAVTHSGLHQLREALRKAEAPCLPNRRAKLKDWWFDYRPRLPDYSVNVYINGEIQFSTHNLNWFEQRVLVRTLPGSETWAHQGVTVQVDKFS